MYKQIGRKIYYEIATGNVIVDTGERTGFVTETTEDQDFVSFTSLSGRNRETVGSIQLSYGQHEQDFLVCNGYRVNHVTQSVEFSYPDPNEPGSPPVYQKALSVEVNELKDQNSQIILALVMNDLM